MAGDWLPRHASYGQVPGAFAQARSGSVRSCGQIMGAAACRVRARRRGLQMRMFWAAVCWQFSPPARPACSAHQVLLDTGACCGGMTLACDGHSGRGCYMAAVSPRPMALVAADQPALVDMGMGLCLARVPCRYRAEGDIRSFQAGSRRASAPATAACAPQQDAGEPAVPSGLDAARLRCRGSFAGRDRQQAPVAAAVVDIHLRAGHGEHFAWHHRPARPSLRLGWCSPCLSSLCSWPAGSSRRGCCGGSGGTGSARCWSGC